MNIFVCNNSLKSMCKVKRLIRACGLVAMIPALGAGGPGFKSRLAPTFYSFSKFIFFNFKLHFINLYYYIYEYS